jgi:Rrf2 family cysteine metabolism transcriptional repressor
MMAISTKGRYSVRILALMASKPRGHLFTKHEIAEAEVISPAYVQQLMMTLRAAELVNSHRGKVGGFTLAKDPSSITVSEVLRASEGPIVMAPCLGMESCEREPGCPTKALWKRAGELLDDLFSSVTIADLVGQDPDGLLQVVEGR